MTATLTSKPAKGLALLSIAALSAALVGCNGDDDGADAEDPQDTADVGADDTGDDDPGSEDEAPEDGEEGAGGAEAAGGDVDACALISADELNEIFDTDFEEGTANNAGAIPGECMWESSAGDETLFLGVLTEDSEVARSPENAYDEYVEQMESQGLEPVELDLGDEALLNPGGLGISDSGAWIHFRHMGLDDQWDEGAPEAAEHVLQSL